MPYHIFSRQQPCIQPPLWVRRQTKFSVCGDFFFLQTYLSKNSFFTLRLGMGIRSQLLAQVHPCSFFLQINSDQRYTFSVLFSVCCCCFLSAGHAPGHRPCGMQVYWRLGWHCKAHFCRQQHDYGEGEGEVEQMCFNTSFFVFITVP